MLLLIRERHRVVPRQELFDVLWPGITVAETSLYRLVKEARAAIGDDGRRQATLRTLPKQGFRFAAQIEVRDDDPHPRLESLEGDCREVLIAASILGVQVELGLLSDLLGRTPDATLEALAPAVEAGLLVVCEEEDEDESATLQFADEDLQQAALEQLDASERHRMHHEAAARLEARRSFREAARHFERSANLHALEGAAENAERSDALVAQARALRHARAFDSSRQAALRAAEAARLAGARQQIAAAALAVPMLLLHGRVDREWVALADEALAGQPEDVPTSVRAELLNRLAYHLYWSRDTRRSRSCNREARALLDGAREPRLLAWICMIDHMLADRAADLSDRLRLAREAVKHAAAAPDADAELYAREQVVNDSLECGDIESARAEADAIELLAERADLPWPARVRILLALHHGDFTAAERLIADADLAQGASVLQAQYRAPQLMWLRFQQGRLGELVPLMRAFVSRSSELPIWRAALALGEWAAGNEREARREFESLASRDFGDLPEDFLVPAANLLLAELCSEFGDEARAAHLYQRLKPHGGRVILLPRASVAFGPTDLLLGKLAAVMGEREAALAHLHDALGLAERTESRPALGRVHAELAVAEAESGNPAALIRARHHAELAGEIARALEMAPTAQRCQQALRSAAG